MRCGEGATWIRARARAFAGGGHKNSGPMTGYFLCSAPTWCASSLVLARTRHRTRMWLVSSGSTDARPVVGLDYGLSDRWPEITRQPVHIASRPASGGVRHVAGSVRIAGFPGSRRNVAGTWDTNWGPGTPH